MDAFCEAVPEVDLLVSNAGLPSIATRSPTPGTTTGRQGGRPTPSIRAQTSALLPKLTASGRDHIINLLSTVACQEVSPGLVETEFSVVRFDGDDDRARKCYERLDPLTGDDIADVIARVASRPPMSTSTQVIVKPIAQADIRVVHRRTALDDGRGGL